MRYDSNKHESWELIIKADYGYIPHFLPDILQISFFFDIYIYTMLIGIYK